MSVFEPWPGKVNVLCPWARHFPLTLLLSIEECKCMSTDKLSGKPDREYRGHLTPTRESSDTRSSLYATKPTSGIVTSD